jgi:arginyl-tRNA synthetase
VLLPTQQIKKILALAISRSQIYNYKYDLDISVRFCYPNFGCHYTSAIAYQLSPKIKKTPLEIAQTIYSELPLNSKLAIAIAGDGMINFTLTETYIRECLAVIDISDMSLNFQPQPQYFSMSTYTQYAYARCCSLLRFAELNPVKSQKIKTELLNSESTPELALWSIAIAEYIYQSHNQSNQNTIKHCQNLTVKFLEYSDRNVNVNISNSEFHIQLIQITKKLLYILASGYINLPEYL